MKKTIKILINILQFFAACGVFGIVFFGILEKLMK